MIFWNQCITRNFTVCIVIKLMLIFVFYCLFQVSSEGEILTYECEELDITTQAVDNENEENAVESEWEK